MATAMRRQPNLYILQTTRPVMIEHNGVVIRRVQSTRRSEPCQIKSGPLSVPSSPLLISFLPQRESTETHPCDAAAQLERSSAKPYSKPAASHRHLQIRPHRAAAVMVYFDSWDEFVSKSVELFRNHPDTTRYVVKYRHCEGKLVLKVTDNHEATGASAKIWCLKFKTDQAQDAKKMEKLNTIFFTLMTHGPDADISDVSGKEQAEQQQSKKGRGRRQ
uniref:Signal recognition particle 9 kDa protein n=1 Tax=Oryza nivara TaxID=4536 RepID=A0A0E0HNM9_ORYNI